MRISLNLLSKIPSNLSCHLYGSECRGSFSNLPDRVCCTSSLLKSRTGNRARRSEWPWFTTVLSAVPRNWKVWSVCCHPDFEHALETRAWTDTGSNMSSSTNSAMLYRRTVKCHMLGRRLFVNCRLGLGMSTHRAQHLLTMRHMQRIVLVAPAPSIGSTWTTAEHKS